MPDRSRPYSAGRATVGPSPLAAAKLVVPLRQSGAHTLVSQQVLTTQTSPGAHSLLVAVQGWMSEQAPGRPTQASPPSVVVAQKQVVSNSGSPHSGNPLSHEPPAVEMQAPEETSPGGQVVLVHAPLTQFWPAGQQVAAAPVPHGA